MIGRQFFKESIIFLIRLEEDVAAITDSGGLLLYSEWLDERGNIPLAKGILHQANRGHLFSTLEFAEFWATY